MANNHELRERIERLETIDGDGTELVTVTVPPDKSIASVRDRIGQERASAANIRSDRTRDRVQRALGRVRRLLSEYRETPANGLAVYAGVVDGDLVSAVFDDLPAPVPESTYRCDDRFAVDALTAAATPGETYGLVVVERGSGALGRLVDGRVVDARTVESHVMGQSRAGGQSAQRFARERERQKREFFDRVASAANDAFLGENPVAGLVVGGTLATVEAFVDGGSLDHRLQDRLLDTYPVEYAGRQGLRQLVDRAEDRVIDQQRREERETLAAFFERLGGDEPVAYGEGEVERAAEFGAVETALVSASVSRERRVELEAAVGNQGGDVTVVGADTERGAQFADAFGVGALLRFPVN